MRKLKQELPVRLAAVAGGFYPEDKKALESQIESFLNRSSLPEGLKKLPAILIVPHAGYDYSGQVAAEGFRELIDSGIKRAVILGISHQVPFLGAAVFDKGFWQTPLGKVAVEADLAKKFIVGSQLIFANQEYHQQEHSLEAEVPFLQKVLKDFRIVPVLMSGENKQLIKELASNLAKNFDARTVLIISSDLSHYPSYEDAKRIDKKTIEAILSGETEKFDQAIFQSMAQRTANLVTCACGETAIRVGMKVAKNLGINDIRLIKYLNSGDTSGDKSRVVGYAAIGFYPASSGLDKEQQKELLRIARKTLETYLTEKIIPQFEIKDDELNEPLGAFVTLRKNGELRGCIGEFEPEIPLWQVVRKMAVEAAVGDHRFPPLTSGELGEIKIEISVLSPRQKIANWREIKLGKHGVIVQRGSRSGVFLPQVAVETGWNLETFLGQLCYQKAGLPWDSWKGKDTELFVFTAQVFEEE